MKISLIVGYTGRFIEVRRMEASDDGFSRQVTRDDPGSYGGAGGAGWEAKMHGGRPTHLLQKHQKDVRERIPGTNVRVSSSGPMYQCLETAIVITRDDNCVTRDITYIGCFNLRFHFPI